ncbi:MAG: hypothetical protein IJS44_05175 [Clostridia bacterium]|nr:hypothetical protein [Clostridia bacterium]
MQQPVQQPYQPQAYAAGGAVRQGIPAPGYSDRVNHPELLAAVKKNRGAAATFFAFCYCNRAGKRV